ncbi:hypothetical protein HII36_29835 [Nonomuraea sp. NN258]|uniref:hypothetical protein n=1 Tax=Nonomuraea antri TaxID=2730852 RepID=UPI0015696333|nr:hypothetical protein [Nonomuraea antri]NRQ36002.1 hypothetical protein [Nonomuraea antri]
MEHVDGPRKLNGGRPVRLCGRCSVILRYDDGSPYLAGPLPPCEPDQPPTAEARPRLLRRLAGRVVEAFDDLLHFDEPDPPCDVADWGFDQPRRP